MTLQVSPACRGSRFALISAAFAAALANVPTAGAGFEPWRGAKSPAFTLTSTDGQTFALEKLRGKPVIVAFFATWCEPCREEFPALSRLISRANDTVNVVAVSVAEPDLRVRRFLQTTPVNFPVVLDGDRAVAKAWGVSQLPSTIILDRNLRPVATAPADFAWDGLEPKNLIDFANGPRGSKR